MEQLANKPKGAVIDVIADADGQLLHWPPPSGGPMRYFMLAFLAIWICGWAVGWVGAAAQLARNPDPEKGFLWIWIIGWTFGGIFAMAMLYLLIRSPKRESVLLGYRIFRYEPGSSFLMMLFNPLYAMKSGTLADPISQLFHRCKRIQLAKEDLGSVVLERIGERQRLYFDHGADRIEIGEFLREPEREWLAVVIQEWQAT